MSPPLTGACKKATAWRLRSIWPAATASGAAWASTGIASSPDTRANPNALRYGQQPTTFAPALWGGFAQFLYLPPNAVLHRVPDSISSHHAAMALPMGNGVQWACIDGGVGAGSTALIMGPGQQGLACVVAARAAGASLVVVAGLSRDEYRLGIARKLGADATIDVEREDLKERIASLTGGAGVDSVIDCTSSHGGEVVKTALEVVKRKGATLLMQANGTVEFPFGEFGRKYVTMRPARGHSYAAVELGLKHIASNRFPLDLIATDCFGLAEVDRAIRSTAGEVSQTAIHVTVTPWA